MDPLLEGFLIFLAVGFTAQLLDGAVGMAYGVISSSVLLAFGVPPAQASATIHAAECFTTGASGASHLMHKNVDWKLLARLAPAGVVGGVAGVPIVPVHGVPVLACPPYQPAPQYIARSAANFTSLVDSRNAANRWLLSSG